MGLSVKARQNLRRQMRLAMINDELARLEIEFPSASFKALVKVAKSRFCKGRIVRR